MKLPFKNRNHIPPAVLIVMLCVSLILTGAALAVESAPETVEATPIETAAVELAKAAPVAKTEPTETEAPAEDELEIPNPEDLQLVDHFTATAYCTTGTTATGTYTTPERTLAVNPYKIRLGSHLYLFLEDGTYVGDFYAEDTGGNMFAHPYVVDIYMGEDSYDECMQWGAQRVTIYTDPKVS